MLEGNCILWKKSLDLRGYGHKIFRADGKWKTTTAHRFTYEKAFGSIPPGYVIHHLCENKACINLKHLKAMSKASHMTEHADASAKGRTLNYCKRGHRLAGDNLFFHQDGRRECRPCSRIRAQEQRQKRSKLD